MADFVDRATRSRMTSGIRSINTKPELTIRHALHRLGFRYRLHSGAVPGRPDMLFRSHNAAVFVHGCFWHGHDCEYFRMPGTRVTFWSRKITANKERDARVTRELTDTGWRQLVIWECAIRGKKPNEVERVISRAARWIRSRKSSLVIRGS